ncbi:MAG TPA: tail fiber domain-containing protein [Phycisphaerae bacterium]|nr:tail fiber domain-containing protein [Phycisphaerae bacterium]HRW53086.1 tail fiber domain-containing protein [Phycisphaerae bacterium]
MKVRILFSLAALGVASTAFGQTGNTTYGTSAGAAITTGTDNTFVGEEAGLSLSSGSRSVFIGRSAGRLFDDDSDIVSIGWMAGSGGDAGSQCVFVGSEAGALNLAYDNVFVGYRAGMSNTSGIDNTFLGEEAGKSNTTGGHNTFVGEDAGYNNTTGDDNTGVGDSALRSCTIGFGNTAVGNEAGYDINTGVHNTAFGNVAGIDIGAGNFNTFLGARSGENTEHADYNTFVGALSGSQNNRTNNTGNANRNTYLGAGAGFSNRDGSNNVVLGALADFGYWSSTDQQLFDGFSDSWNGTVEGASYHTNISRTVIVGASAYVESDDGISVGYGAAVRAPRSVSIGANARATHTDAISIGYGATSHADATVVIGNDTTAAWHPGADGVTALGDAAYRFSNVSTQSCDVVAGASQDASIELWADNGAADDDKWQIGAADGGDFSISSGATGAYVPRFTVQSDGDVIVPGEISINSDIRLKRDIQSIPNALDLVRRIDGRTYLWREGVGRDDRRHYGLIAQQVEGVIPELVRESEAGVKSVNYQAMVPVLVEAMKDLQRDKDAEIARLRDANAELATRLARIERLIERLDSTRGDDR